MKKGTRSTQLNLLFGSEPFNKLLKEQRRLHKLSKNRKANELRRLLEAMRSKGKGEIESVERRQRISRTLRKLVEVIGAGAKKSDEFERVLGEIKRMSGEESSVGFGSSHRQGLLRFEGFKKQYPPVAMKRRLWERSRITFGYIERNFKQVIPIVTDIDALISLRRVLIDGLTSNKNMIDVEVDRGSKKGVSGGSKLFTLVLPSSANHQQRLEHIMDKLSIVDALLLANNFNPSILRPVNKEKLKAVLMKKFGIVFERIPTALRENAFNVHELLRLRAKLVRDYSYAEGVLASKKRFRGKSAASGEGAPDAMSEKQSIVNRLKIVDALLKANGVKPIFLTPLR